MRRGIWPCLAALVAALVPASASASTLGSVAQGNGGCSPNLIWAGTGDAYTVPAGGGVITSLSTNTHSSSGHVSLKLVRADSTGNLTVVGATPLQTITAAGTITVPGLRIQSFGPFEVWVGERRIADGDYRARRHKYFLAYLASCAGRPVPEERLIDELWPDDPDRGQRGVYRATSELRKLLLPRALEETPA